MNILYIDLYYKICMYNLLNWINIDKIDWHQLSANISDKSIHILENNLDK
jgi:hypothetical protein